MGSSANNTMTPFSGAATAMQQAGNLASTVGQNVNMNPYTQGVIDNLQADTLKQQQMSQNMLGAQAQAAGAFGGSRHGIAEGQMLADANQNFLNTSAGLRNDAWNHGVQNQFGQINALSGLAGQGFGMGMDLQNMQQGISNQQTALQQQLIDAAKSQYAGWTGAPLQGLNMYSSILGGTPYSTTTTQSQSPGLLGILGAGLSLF